MHQTLPQRGWWFSEWVRRPHLTTSSLGLQSQDSISFSNCSWKSASDRKLDPADKAGQREQMGQAGAKMRWGHWGQKCSGSNWAAHPRSSELWPPTHGTCNSGPACAYGVREVSQPTGPAHCPLPVQSDKLPMPSSTKTDILGGQEAGTEAWHHFNSKQKGVLTELCLPYSVEPSASSPPPQADLSGPHSTLSRTTHHGPQGPSIRGERPRAWSSLQGSAFLSNVAFAAFGHGTHSQTRLRGGGTHLGGPWSACEPAYPHFLSSSESKNNCDVNGG